MLVGTRVFFGSIAGREHDFPPRSILHWLWPTGSFCHHSCPDHVDHDFETKIENCALRLISKNHFCPGIPLPQAPERTAPPPPRPPPPPTSAEEEAATEAAIRAALAEDGLDVEAQAHLMRTFEQKKNSKNSGIDSSSSPRSSPSPDHVRSPGGASDHSAYYGTEFSSSPGRSPAGRSEGGGSPPPVGGGRGGNKGPTTNGSGKTSSAGPSPKPSPPPGTSYASSRNVSLSFVYVFY